MTCLALPLIPLNPGSSRSDTGLSKEASKLRALELGSAEYSPSVSTGEPLREAVDSLLDAVRETQSPAWIAEGWAPVDVATIGHALRFLTFLPNSLSRPDLMIHPDGEIAFEWHLDPRRVLTISLNPSGRLSYAGLFGFNKAHGTEYFDEYLPEAVALNLQRLFSSGQRVK